MNYINASFFLYCRILQPLPYSWFQFHFAWAFLIRTLGEEAGNISTSISTSTSTNMNTSTSLRITCTKPSITTLLNSTTTTMEEEEEGVVVVEEERPWGRLLSSRRVRKGKKTN